MSRLTIKCWQFFPYCFLFCFGFLYFHIFAKVFVNIFWHFRTFLRVILAKMLDFRETCELMRKICLLTSKITCYMIRSRGKDRMMSKVSLVLNIFKIRLLCIYLYIQIWEKPLLICAFGARFFLHFPCNRVFFNIIPSLYHQWPCQFTGFYP